MRVIYAYFLGCIFGLAIKVFFIVVVSVEPGQGISPLLKNQAYVVFAVNLIVLGGIFYLGVWTYRSFGKGVMSIIRKANDDVVKEVFL